jgi:hypothetical protein
MREGPRMGSWPEVADTLLSPQVAKIGMDSGRAAGDAVKPQSFELNLTRTISSSPATSSLMRTVRLCAIIALGMALGYAFKDAVAGKLISDGTATAIVQVLK